MIRVRRKRLVALLGLLLAIVTVVFGLGLHRRPRFIRNFEDEEYGQVEPFVKPTLVEEGLAIYAVGDGEPVLLFPYPHAHATVPMAQGGLAKLLTGIGRQVVTFDVPGAFRSTREPIGDMDEILRAADESLERLGIAGPIDVVGHSMSGLSALAFAIERPERTRRLVLVGSMSGFPAAARWGLPRSAFHVLDPDFWRVAIWGIRINAGRGDLALHKKLQNLMAGATYYDPASFEPLAIDEDDRRKGVPIRMIWNRNMYRRLSYADRLGSVRAPTLLIVGRHDKQAPLPCSQELLAGMPDARLVVFERSGHYPFTEEAAAFTTVLDDFLNPGYGMGG